jgi:hypothetical protein
MSVACESLARLLEASYDPALLDGTALQFLVYGAKDFEDPMKSGVSVFPFRITPNAALRTPPSKRGLVTQQRHMPQLAVDVHFLVTAWAPQASLELAILGWTMRVIEDQCVLPASLLNGVTPGTFGDDEAVVVMSDDLPMEDMMRIWDGLPHDYQLSVPYLAHAIRIESLRSPTDWNRAEQREMGAVFP